MAFFVILVLIVIAIVVSDSSNKKKRAEEEQREAQKAKTDVASASHSIFRLLEALDILEDEIKGYSGNLGFYRSIGSDMETHDSVFELKYCIINSKRNPSVKETIDSIVHEEVLRNRAKKSGETLPAQRSSDNYTVWRHLTDEQFDVLSDTIPRLDQKRDEDNDIVLTGSLPLRFDNPSNYNSYMHRASVYVRALAEAIHAKFPAYGFEADTYGIHFRDKNGVVSYNGI